MKNWLLAFIALGGASIASSVQSAPASSNSAAWALQPLHPAGPPPAVRRDTSARNPIDQFIESKLKEKGLSPAPAASRTVLVRRLFFDLTGLPPTPEDVARFVADPGADNALIEKLLASPRYGERMARFWMDVVHFAETHGNDQDRIRTNAWPYRDYLIASFNRDKPYARFVEEQVAGDVLFPDDSAATVALGFLASGPWDESSLRDIREDTLDRQIGRYLDRDDIVTTVMQTFTSTTVQCARCHDHKFDPIPQRDYYALQAVFAGIDKAERFYDVDPVIHRRRRDLRSEQADLRGDPSHLIRSRQPQIADWEAERRDAPMTWRPIDPDVFVSAAGATLTRQSDGSFLASGPHGPTDTYTFTATSPLEIISAIRLEVFPDDSLPQRGPGREANGNMHLSEFQALLFELGAPAPRRIDLQNPSSDYDQPGWTIAHSLDRDDKTAWGIYPKVGEPHQAVFELSKTLSVPAGSKLTFALRQLHGGHCIGRLRLSVTDVQPATRAAVIPEAVQKIVATPAASRSDEQRIALGRYVLADRIRRELATLPAPSRVYAGASDFEPDGGLKPSVTPRPVHVLRRGEITKPLEEATAGTLSCVSNLPARFALPNPQDEGSRRAALARWLTDPDNPLLWRSIVNRVWQQHFGQGIVSTPNDFGRMGGAPSHPELLDWLALWFRDQAHGSLKQLHQLIVSSATYRQASEVPRDRQASAVAIDPDNHLLWRMNLGRLDAEQLRDAVLQISGRLDLRMGGPSDRQFDLQPGIHVTPKVDYTKFDLDQAAARRRSVYRFLFRTLPDPFMDALDCPAGDQLTPARNTSVTVQQALSLWNNVFMTRQAENLEARLAAAGRPLEGNVEQAIWLILNRAPRGLELAEFSDHARQHGLASLSRVLFNSNEFMFIR